MPSSNRDVRALTHSWLARAEEDLGVAKQLIQAESPYLHAAAFHAQQAAEKFLKALLVHYQREFPKTHDLAALLDILAVVDKETAQALSSLDTLNPYAVEARYPGDYPNVEVEAASTALSLAETAKSCVRARIG